MKNKDPSWDKIALTLLSLKGINMASPTTASPTPSLSIDLMSDLKYASALRAALDDKKSTVFLVFGDLLKYPSIQEAAKVGATARIGLTTAPTWTAGPVTFCLTPAATCTIAASPVSNTFKVAMSIEDTTKTTPLTATAPAGCVYVNIGLDFDIKGSVSGTGTAGPIGITGKTSGSKELTLTFSQPVPADLTTAEAVKLALSQLVFPVDPKCAESMETGAIANVNFDGKFNCEMDVTYGIADYKVSAPSVANVQSSLQKVATLVQPSIELKTGVTGSVSYSHEDHFCLLINKTDNQTAMLYLLRSAEDCWSGSIGVTSTVTAKVGTVTVDPAQVEKAIQTVTGNHTPSSTAQPESNLQTGLGAKLKSWASDETNQAGLTASLSRQKDHTALFTFKVDLSAPALSLAEASWTALVGGDVFQALQRGGFALQPGSGVDDSLKRTCKLQFQFFNLYSIASTTDYFSNAYTEFATDGTIRVFNDQGAEQSLKLNNKSDTIRIHFVATANEDSLKDISKAEVDLQIDLSEKASPKAAAVMPKVIGLLPGSSAVDAAITAMSGYVTSHPEGTLTLTSIIKPAAYRNLRSSTQSADRTFDQSNWNAFRSATKLLNSNAIWASQLQYNDWAAWNESCIDPTGSLTTPNRHERGNYNAGNSAIPTGIADVDMISFYFRASSGFMNLCEDLQTLAAAEQGISTEGQWMNLMAFINDLVKNDIFIDYGKPVAGALLQQTGFGVPVTSSADQSTDGKTMTCTVTIG